MYLFTVSKLHLSPFSHYSPVFPHGTIPRCLDPSLSFAAQHSNHLLTDQVAHATSFFLQ